MKKEIRATIGIVILFALLVVWSVSVSAATNPYPQWQTIGGIRTITCTSYAWQQVYDNFGVALPNFGNAVNWYNRASESGYAVGTVAKANSVAVWSGDTYGHVSYVVSVNGNKMTVNEAGMTSNGAAYNGNGIFNGNVVNSIVGQQKGNGSSKILIGFIYPGETAKPSFASASEKNSVTASNAVLWGLLTKPSAVTISKIGIQVRPDGASYTNENSRYDAPSKNYSGEPKVYIYYDLNAELGLTLKHATKYYYRFYANVNGADCWSEEYTVTTTGTHTFGEWKTSTSPTCTASGTKIRSCSCGKTESSSIPAQGHSYSSSFTIDLEASCTVAGSRSRHCVGCSAKIDVTKIPATGHVFGAWNTVKNPTCSSPGNKQRTCKCGKTESESIAALGHNFAASWTIDKTATCVTAGSKSYHCSRCTATTNTTPIDPLGHSFGEWNTIKVASCVSSGIKQRTCHCGATDIENIPATGHQWQNWKTTVAPTESTEGKETRTCQSCSQTEVKSIPLLSSDGHVHNFGDWQITKEATCQTSGTSERACIICNAKECMEIAAKGHAFGNWYVATEPTQTTEGLSERICNICNLKETLTTPILNSDSTPEENISSNGISNEDTSVETETGKQADEDNKKIPISPIVIRNIAILVLLSGAAIPTILFIIKKQK